MLFQTHSIHTFNQSWREENNIYSLKFLLGGQREGRINFIYYNSRIWPLEGDLLFVQLFLTSRCSLLDYDRM